MILLLLDLDVYEKYNEIVRLIWFNLIELISIIFLYLSMYYLLIEVL